MCGGAVLLTSSEVTDRPVDRLNDFCQVLMARLMEGTSIWQVQRCRVRAICNLTMYVLTTISQLN